jgi:hypothetical protein
MTSFESLPRELRQEIFTLAFDYAIHKDLELNDFIRQTSYSHHSTLALRYSIPGTPWKERPNYLQDVENDDLQYTHAPNLYKLAQSLCSVYSELHDDVRYVLHKSLVRLAEDDRDVWENFEGGLPVGHYNTTVFCALRAKKRGEPFEAYDDVASCILVDDWRQELERLRKISQKEDDNRAQG